MDQFEGLLLNSEYYPRYHIILTTLNSDSIFKGEIKRIVEQCLSKLRWGDECFVMNFRISPNHLHFLAVIPTFYSVEEIINDIKTETSQQIAVHHYHGVYHLIWSRDFYISELGDDEGYNLDKWHQASEIERRRKYIPTQ